jgi:hypothetical protein
MRARIGCAMARTIGLVLALIIGASGASCGDPAPTGASCVSGGDCKSGHCLSDGNGMNRRCTGRCMTNADCPAGVPLCENLGPAPPFEWAAGQLWCVLPLPTTP